MSHLPTVLQDFAGVCQSHFGSNVVGVTDDSVHVTVEGCIVHVNLDQKAGRAIFWTELAWPDRSDVAALDQAALQFSSREFLDHAFVLGINRAANFIVLGRSIEQDVLQQYAGLKLLSTVAALAGQADAALAAACSRPEQHALEIEQTHIRM